MLSESKVNEAPMGMIQRGVQGLKSMVPGSIGQKATGSLEAGKAANQLYKEYNTYLGRTGQQMSQQSLVAFLKSAGIPAKIINSAAGVAPVKRARKPVPTPAPTPTPEAAPPPAPAAAFGKKQVNAILMKVSQALGGAAPQAQPVAPQAQPAAPTAAAAPAAPTPAPAPAPAASPSAASRVGGAVARGAAPQARPVAPSAPAARAAPAAAPAAPAAPAPAASPSAASRVGSAVARGAKAVGSAAVKGAKAVGGAVAGAASGTAPAPAPAVPKVSAKQAKAQIDQAVNNIQGIRTRDRVNVVNYAKQKVNALTESAILTDIKKLAGLK